MYLLKQSFRLLYIIVDITTAIKRKTDTDATGTTIFAGNGVSVEMSSSIVCSYSPV